MVDYANLHGLVKTLAEESVCPVCGGNNRDAMNAFVRLPFVDDATERTKVDEGVGPKNWLRASRRTESTRASL